MDITRHGQEERKLNERASGKEKGGKELRHVHFTSADSRQVLLIL